MHVDVVEVCAIIVEKLRMLGNVGVEEVVSVREVFLYVCWGQWSVEVMGCCQYPVCLQQDKYVQSDFFNPNFVYTVCIPFLYHPYAFRLCSGHDCGVYVMVFMDILSIKTDGLYFDPHYVWHMRDLCLQHGIRRLLQVHMFMCILHMH